jgi:hypothetical protein
MPELLTQYPDVALEVLRSEGARCGAGIEPKILTRCQPERFCALAGGELCVYGPQELHQMTQLSRAELCASHASARCAIDGVGPYGSGAFAVLATLATTVVLGALRMRRSRARRAT